MRKPKVTVPKLWGHEEIIVNNDLYCGKLLFVDKGATSSYHFHISKKETFYILRGVVALVFDGRTKIMYTGDSITIDPKTRHSFHGQEDSVIIEISTPHRDEDVVRIETSRAAI